MRGIENLRRMRRAGSAPSVVFIDADAGPQALPQWAQWQHIAPHLCDIDVEAADSLLRIDWRPVVGLTVHVSGLNEKRVRAIAAAVDAAGAKRVISSLVERLGIDEWVTFKTVWIHDTDGQFAEEAHGACVA